MRLLEFSNFMLNGKVRTLISSTSRALANRAFHTSSRTLTFGRKSLTSFSSLILAR